MNTVYTPDSLARSVSNGKYKTCRLKELINTDTDEIFVFVFPSPDLIDMDNGDGCLLEVWDYAMDLSSITTSRGEIPSDPDTIIYYTLDD